MKKITLTLFFTLGLIIFCNAQELLNLDHESSTVGDNANTLGYQSSGGGASIEVGLRGFLADGTNQVIKAVHAAGKAGLYFRSPNMSVSAGDLITVKFDVSSTNLKTTVTLRYSKDDTTSFTITQPDEAATSTNGVHTSGTNNGVITENNNNGTTTTAKFTVPAGFNNARVQIFNGEGDINFFELDNLIVTKIPALSINDLSKFSFSSYPNPAKNYLNLSAAKSINKIEIYNLLGQNVLNKAINSNKSEINVSNLSKGVYAVRVFIENAVGSYKFIKE